ncbi:MAG: thioesterase [Anaerovoracaceae bacterium]
MEIPFKKDYKVSYFEVDYTMQVKPHRLVGIFQDLAVAHSDAAGFNLEWFDQNDKGWIITGWHVVINKRPTEGQKLSIATWSRRHKRVQADRTFEAKDEQGNLVFYAESRWFLMDRIRRKPTRIPENFMENYGVWQEGMDPKYKEPLIKDETYGVVGLEDLEYLGSREFAVTRRDTDTNNHTNNITYIEWAMDDIEDELYLDYEIKDIKVKYDLECKKGDLVRSNHYGRKLEDGRIEVSSVFQSATAPATDQDQPSDISGETAAKSLSKPKTHCQVTTIWQNKYK